MIILGFGYFVYWNTNSSNPSITKQDKPPELLNHEGNLKQALEYKYPLYFLKWHHKLIIEKSPLVSINETNSSIITKIKFSKNNHEYLYVHTQFKEEVTYRTEEHNVFEFDVIFYENNHVVFQFSGHINNNQNPPTIENLDVLAFMEGFWEENLIIVDSNQ